VTTQRPFDSGGSRLAEVGEAALLARLVSAARSGRHTGGARVVLGAGDDAAVWRPDAHRDVVITQDALVEGEDFCRAWTTPHMVGRKAIAVSLSDLAGMGAVPALCVATICARDSTEMDDVLGIQEGILAVASAHECRLVGGDVSRIDGPLVLDVVAVGTVEPDRCLRRDRGRPGDVLVVTGVLGRAAAGLQVLRDGPRRGGAGEAAWIHAQCAPDARIREGIALVARGVHCGGDASDGLLADTARTARESGCGVELWADAVPVDPALRERFPDRWLEHAIGGGEDFELVCAVPPGRIDELLASWPAGLAPLTVVGRLTEEPDLRVLTGHNGDDMTIPPVHSRHFA
jgi:thiamine-monophosphate kinase